MKGNYKNIYSFGILVLLLLSCSLTSPTPNNEVTQSTSAYSKPSDLSLPLHKPKTKHCTVKTGYEKGLLNLRLGAGLDFDVLIVLNEGDRLEVLASGTWLRVSTADAVVGYINSKFCTTGE